MSPALKNPVLFLLTIFVASVLSCNFFQGDTGIKKTILAASMETVPPAPPEGAFQLSQFGITWFFADTPGQYGRFANGDHWVVGPVSIIYIAPLSFKSRWKRVWNGSMVNPSPRSGMDQGYDSAMYGQYGPAYDPSLNAGFPDEEYLSADNPLVLQPGSSLVSTISAPEPGARSQLESAAILTVLDTAPPDGSFRPPYCGSDKTACFNESDLQTGLLANLGSSAIAEVPDMTAIERYFERPWIDHVPGWVGGCVHPVSNMPNYGREIASQVGEGALMLHLDFSLEEKRTLLIRYVQLGIDLYGIVMDGGEENWPPNGGHASGRKWPIMFAGLMLNDPDMAGIGLRSGDYTGTGRVHFGEDGQTFYVTAEDVALDHHPDERSCEIEYTTNDIGLPEWGIVHALHPAADNKNWETVYRQCCTTNAWAGFILSALIMGQKTSWNHDVIFDYTDRYMTVEMAINGTGAWTRQWSRFTENMWDHFRADYGAIWPSGTTWQGIDLLNGLFCD
ncbi:MAG: hypothetical protein JXA07_13180 [Spirochaetes bacterium]|nr:hypothetical protein [Spirochaetota bacterium]